MNTDFSEVVLAHSKKTPSSPSDFNFLLYHSLLGSYKVTKVNLRLNLGESSGCKLLVIP